MIDLLMSPTGIMVICFACVVLTVLLVYLDARAPDSKTGDPYLDHLYEIGAKDAAKEIITEDEMRGTFHDARIKPGAAARGMIFTPGAMAAAYGKPPKPYHTGRRAPLTKNRNEFGQRKDVTPSHTPDTTPSYTTPDTGSSYSAPDTGGGFSADPSSNF